MRELLSLSFKSLVSSATRWLLALFAIALGVTGIVASLTINNALTRSLELTASELLGNADAELISMSETGFSADALNAIAALPQLDAVAPRLTKLTYYEVGDGSQYRGFLNLTGIDPVVDPTLHPITLAEGDPLVTGDTGVLVPQSGAQQVGLGVGDELRLITSGGFKNFKIKGLLAGTSSLGVTGHPAALVTLDTMRQDFALGARASDIGVRYAPGQAAAAQQAIAGALHEPYLLLDVRAVQAELAGNQRDFRWLLSLFGVVAIVAGGVEILNTLSILANRRARELALMRAAGASRGQVMTILLFEALIVGAIGSLLGLLLGWIFAGVLSGLVQVGQGVAIDVGFDASAALAGLVAGMLVALLAALGPAWNVARREPLEALRQADAAPPSARSYVLPAVVTLVLLVFFGLAIWALLGQGPGVQPAILLAGFAAVLFIGLVLILLSLVPLLISLIGVLLRSSGSGLAVLAQRSLRWRSGRTALTVSALSIAVTLLTTLFVLASSATSVGDRTLAALFAAPYVVVAPVAQPAQFIDVISSESGAAAVSPLRKVTLSWDGRFVDAVALDPAFYKEDRDALPLVEGDRDAALDQLQSSNWVLVPADYAERYGLNVGSTMSIWTPAGPQPFAVAGLLRRSFPAADPAGAIVLSLNSLKSNFGVDSFTQLLVRPAGADFTNRLSGVAERYGMQAQSTTSLAEDISRSISQTLLLFGALTGTVALVGTLSIINAMSLNILERAPTIGLMRAAGMSSNQVTTSILIEAALLGFVAGVLGVLLGSGIAWLLFGAGRISQIATFSVPWWVILLIPATAFLATLAAIYPALQTANTSAVGAVRSRAN